VGAGSSVAAVVVVSSVARAMGAVRARSAPRRSRRAAERMNVLI
jgi:hypothetical protein